jgi:hypothetical protein
MKGKSFNSRSECEPYLLVSSWQLKREIESNTGRVLELCMAASQSKNSPEAQISFEV